MVTQHINLFRNLETVVRELDERGHETIMLHGTPREMPGARASGAAPKPKMAFMGRGMEVAEARVASLSTGHRPDPDRALRHKLARFGRKVMNRSIYLRRAHPAPERVLASLDRSLPRGMKCILGSRAIGAVLSQPRALRAWRRLEGSRAPSRRIASMLADVRPDVVLVSPSVWPKDPVEADYLHAAHTLGIPTVGYLNSWDNLTSKGTLHVLPDVFIVWNEALATEAERIHLIPRDIIRVTGAPHLDHFFELAPSVPHAETCRQLGCRGEGPYVVYLCSSRTLIADETHIVTRLADSLRRVLGDAAPTIVVRPHPVNPAPWQRYACAGTAVYPRQGDQADTPESWQDYFNQLAGAACFVGLNTTAFLEAAVADHPCLTIVSDEFYEQQGRTGHFRHLLEADFLEVCADVDAVAAGVARVLGGADQKAAGRRQFVERFLRPRGVRIPARSVVADTILELAAP